MSEITHSASDDFVVVVTTYADDDSGQAMIKALLEEKLAACVQVYPVQSFYHWDGEIQSDDEKLVMIKTRRELFDALSERIKMLHPYDVPEIIMLPIPAGSADYLGWIRETCRAI